MFFSFKFLFYSKRILVIKYIIILLNIEGEDLKSKILIIEDELIEAMSFEQSLKSVGFEVVGISSTGKDALDKVAELKPDLVLMDIILKGDMDGIETAAKINENYDIPIVYLTAHPEKSTVDRAKLTSPYGYLIKPVNITVLKNTIDMALYKHRTDQKLKESEERFKASFNQAPVGMVLSGSDRRIFKANKKFCDLIGYSNEELQGQLFYELTYDDDLEISHKAVESLFSGEKEKINLIKRYVHKDGHIIWADVNVVLFHDENQKPLFFISHVQDITQRKKSETALKKSERLLADMFDFLPDATFAIDHEGKVIAWNRALEEMTGYLKEDMLGKGDYEYAIPWYGIRRPILIDLIGDEGSEYVGKYDFIDKEGQTLKAEVFVPSLYGGRGAYVWVKASKLLDHEGKMYGAIESVRDITDRKDAENRLKRSEQRFRAVAESAVDGIVTTDQNGEILFYNESLGRIFGYSRDELIGANLTILMPDRLKDDYLKGLKIYKESGEHRRLGKTLKTRGLRKDGTEFSFEMSLSAWRSGGRNFFTSIIRDITERKKAEEALKKSERLLADMFDFLPDATFAIDHEGKVIAWNRALEEMTGYLKEDMLGKGDYEYAIPWYGEKRPILIDLIGDEGSEYVGKYDFIDKEGQTLKAEVFVPSLYGGRGAYVWVKASKLLDHKGRMYGAIESVRDITDRKDAENRLKRSEQRFRAVAESAVDGIVTTDQNGNIILFNKSLTEIFGYEKKEIMRKSLTILMPDRFRKNYLNELNNFKRSGQHRLIGRTVVTTGLKKDDTEFPFEMSLSAWKSEDKIYFTSIIRDITERKKAENALKNSESFLNSIIDQSPHPMWISDSEGYLIRINQACLDLLDITREEVMGSYNIFKDDIVEEQGYMPLIRGVFEEGRTVNFELVYDSKQLKHLALKNYVHIILDVTIFPIKDAQGRVTNAVIQHRNITEIKKAEIRIKKSLEEKEILLKEIHHRVKNNLQIVSSVLDLQGSYVKTDPTAVNVLKESQNRVFSMALIHEMLYQSKDLNKINFDDYIKSLISHLFHSYRLKIPIDSVIDVKDVSLNIETAVPCGLIISELVSNSLKYAFDDEKSGEIRISLKSKDNEYELIISDNGVGFPENLDYKNIKLSLGLQLVNSLVNQLDGSMELDRSQGTRYTIKFKEQIYKNRI